MFKRKLDYIIDIETINCYAPQWGMDDWQKAIFNIGITAVERISRKKVFQAQYGIDKVWSVPKRFIMDFYRKNFVRSEFDRMFETFKEFTEWFNESTKELAKEYDIEFWSYNAMFDSDGFRINAEREKVKLTKLTDDWSYYGISLCVLLQVSLYKTNHL